MKRLLALVVVGAFGVEACGGPAHLQLPTAPDQGAPREARMAAYRRYRPTDAMITHRLTVNGYGQVVSANTSLDSVTLADGTQVTYPEDLSPLVHPSSETAQAARTSANLRTPSAWLYWGGSAALVGSLFLLIPAAITSADDWDSRGMRIPGDDTLMWTTVGVAAVGLVAGLVGAVLGMRSSSQRQRAFSTYDSSLRERLGLCSDGTQIGDCPNAAASAGPPAPPEATNTSTF